MRVEMLSCGERYDWMERSDETLENRASAAIVLCHLTHANDANCEAVMMNAGAFPLLVEVLLRCGQGRAAAAEVLCHLADGNAADRAAMVRCAKAPAPTWRRRGSDDYYDD
jgi:hypothetical protein